MKNLDLRQGRRTIPFPIYRVDPVNGSRTLHAELKPHDPAGVFIIDRVRMSADGVSYLYSIRRNISHLLLLEGLALASRVVAR